MIVTLSIFIAIVECVSKTNKNNQIESNKYYSEFGKKINLHTFWCIYYEKTY